MKTVPLTEDKYSEWDEFCLRSDDAWFWHTTEWLEFILNLRPNLNPISKSFLVYDNSRVKAICPIIVEEKNWRDRKIKEISFDGSYGPQPALSNDLNKTKRKNYLKFIFRYIDSLANENRIKRSLMKFSPLLKSYSKENFNYLLNFGFFDCPFNTRVINLTKSLTELRSDVRHGHDAAIDSAKKELEVELYNKDNITYEIFDEYRKLHHKAAGRVTRPRKTFEMMFEWIKADSAFLVGAKTKDKFVGFSHFIKYKDGAYYASSCNDPEMKSIGMGHLIQWNAIEWMKKNKITLYEVGFQSFSNDLFDCPSEKEINISRFKAGFGGFTLPVFRGEKYYDSSYFTEIFKDRVEKCASKLPTHR